MLRLLADDAFEELAERVLHVHVDFGLLLRDGLEQLLRLRLYVDPGDG